MDGTVHPCAESAQPVFPYTVSARQDRTGTDTRKAHSGESESTWLQSKDGRKAVPENSQEKGVSMEQLRGKRHRETSKPACSDLRQHLSQIHMDSFFTPKEVRHLKQCFMQKAGLTHFLFPPQAQLLPSLSISSCPLNLCPGTRKQRF